MAESPQESQASADAPKSQKGRGSPFIGLAESVGLLEKIAEALGNGPFGRDAIAEAIGHKPGSGSANAKIGALTHFGLLDRNGGGTYSASEIASKILHPTHDGEKQAGMVAAAKSPTLYAELIEKYQGKGLPSMLGNILYREFGVLQISAEEVANRFRETMLAVGLLRNGILHSEPGENLAVPSVTPIAASPSSIDSNEASSDRIQLPSGTRQERSSTTSGDVILTWPERLTTEEVEDVEAWLQIVLRKLKRAATAATVASQKEKHRDQE